MYSLDEVKHKVEIYCLRHLQLEEGGGLKLRLLPSCLSAALNGVTAHEKRYSIYLPIASRTAF